MEASDMPGGTAPPSPLPPSARPLASPHTVTRRVNSPPTQTPPPVGRTTEQGVRSSGTSSKKKGEKKQRSGDVRVEQQVTSETRVELQDGSEVPISATVGDKRLLSPGDTLLPLRPGGAASLVSDLPPPSMTSHGQLRRRRSNGVDPIVPPSMSRSISATPERNSGGGIAAPCDGGIAAPGGGELVQLHHPLSLPPRNSPSPPSSSSLKFGASESPPEEVTRKEDSLVNSPNPSMNVEDANSSEAAAVRSTKEEAAAAGSSAKEAAALGSSTEAATAPGCSLLAAASPGCSLLAAAAAPVTILKAPAPENSREEATLSPLIMASVCQCCPAALAYMLTCEANQDPPMTVPTKKFLALMEKGHKQTISPLPAIKNKSSLLKGRTCEGDTLLHLAANRGHNPGSVECAIIINARDPDLLFVVNKARDTALHSAARKGETTMIRQLKLMASQSNRHLELLRAQNYLNETALHEAVRSGNLSAVHELMMADSLLAKYPLEGTSPLCLAISQNKIEIAEMIYELSCGKLSYGGPNGGSALHAAACRDIGTINIVLNWNRGLTAHRDIDGSTPLHLLASFKCSDAFKVVFAANPTATYQADDSGMYPIHVAAAVGATGIIRIMLDTDPTTASLRTSEGYTFLHVAVQKKQLSVVSFVCRAQSLSWILNMTDINGNTALHLSAQSDMLRIFGFLYENKDVHLTLVNNSGESPVDLARNRLPRGLFYNLNNESMIYEALKLFGINHSGVRLDLYEKKYSRELSEEDKVKEAEKLKDTSQTFGVGSVFILTVALGACFSVPGGFIADDHKFGGTPTLARRYAFDGFFMATAIAFMCALLATLGLMFSGSPMVSLRTRTYNLGMSVFFMSSSLSAMSACFMLGTYMLLAPGSHATAIAILVISPLALLYRSFEFILKASLLSKPMYSRLGPTRALCRSGYLITGKLCTELWPFLIVFLWAEIARRIRNYSGEE